MRLALAQRRWRRDWSWIHPLRKVRFSRQTSASPREAACVAAGGICFARPPRYEESKNVSIELQPYSHVASKTNEFRSLSRSLCQGGTSCQSGSKLPPRRQASLIRLKELLHLLAQFSHTDRFLQISIKARIEGLLVIPAHGEGRQSYDLETCPARAVSDLPDQRNAVDGGYLDIQKDKIGQPFLQLAEHFLAVVDDEHLVSKHFEAVMTQFTQSGVIIGHQYALHDCPLAEARSLLIIFCTSFTNLCFHGPFLVIRPLVWRLRSSISCCVKSFPLNTKMGISD